MLSTCPSSRLQHLRLAQLARAKQPMGAASALFLPPFEPIVPLVSRAVLEPDIRSARLSSRDALHFGSPGLHDLRNRRVQLLHRIPTSWPTARLVAAADPSIRPHHMAKIS